MFLENKMTYRYLLLHYSGGWYGYYLQTFPGKPKLSFGFQQKTHFTVIPYATVILNFLKVTGLSHDIEIGCMWHGCENLCLERCWWGFVIFQFSFDFSFKQSFHGGLCKVTVYTYHYWRLHANLFLGVSFLPEIV